MSKHTPGPWVIIPGGDEWNQGRIATIEPKPETMVETNYWTVAEVNHRRDEHAANANLIAAAPEMLALLEEARSILEMWKDVAPAVSLCADIDKAIARAKGESQ